MPRSSAMDPSSSAPTLQDAVRRRIARQVQQFFNDPAKGERPVIRSPDALFEPGSVIWRVHGDVTSMMIGGIGALLMQMLHPAALTGVWEHSRFRDDMHGRLRRTARFIAVTTYGQRDDALAAIEAVRTVHGRIRGRLPDGTTYAASDPHLLAWVHLCEAIAFLDAWIAFGEPSMSVADQDLYFRQAALVARKLGADPVPESRLEAVALVAQFRGELRADARSRRVAALILNPPGQSLALAPVQKLLKHAALQIVPDWTLDMHGLSRLPLSGPMVRGGAFTLAQTLRWAFGQRLRRPL